MRTASLVTAALGLAAAAPLAAQETPAQPQPQERVHVVRRGETLWDIARSYLNDPFLWPEIFRLNTRVVEDPALIYPSERLVLPDNARGERPASGDGRTAFYPRSGPQQQSGLNIRRAGTADVPVVAPGDFYAASFVARETEVTPVGQIAEVVSPTVVPIELAPQIQPYDRVYVPLAAGGSLRVGERVSLLRRGDRVEPYGRRFTSTGLGTVAALDGNVATVVVTRLYDRADIGDYVVPAAAFPVRAGVAPVASSGLEGRVLGFAEPSVVQLIESVAFLDVGRNSGVREGDEFEAFIPRERRSWGERPEIPVARMQVVRVTDQTASVRITSLEQPAMKAGLPVRRVLRMP